MTLKITALTVGAVAFVGTGAMFAQEQTNPFIDRGSHYELPIVSDIPQDEKVLIAKDRAAMTLTGWRGEYAITIEPQIPTTRQPFNVPANRPPLSKRMEYRSGDVTAFIEQRSDNEFDIDFTLDRKPNTNVFEYTIDGAEDFDFFFQPELTQEEIDNGAFRPENVVGSYAVYHKTKKNHRVGSTNYATGKVMHIYRPKAIDDNGDEVWAELSYTDGVLSVTVPQSFLDSATYPVVVDPALGYTTQGASAFAFAINNFDRARRSGEPTAMPEDGTLDSISAYVQLTTAGTSETVTTSVFVNQEDSAGADSHGEIATAEQDIVVTTTSALKTWTMGSQSLTSGTSYILNIVGDGADIPTANAIANVNYDDATSDAFYEEQINGGYATLIAEDPWTEVDANSTTHLSIYATYTATGGTGFDVRGDIEVHGDAVYRQ